MLCNLQKVPVSRALFVMSPRTTPVPTMQSPMSSLGRLQWSVRLSASVALTVSCLLWVEWAGIRPSVLSLTAPDLTSTSETYTDTCTSCRVRWNVKGIMPYHYTKKYCRYNIFLLLRSVKGKVCDGDFCYRNNTVFCEKFVLNIYSTSNSTSLGCHLLLFCFCCPRCCCCCYCYPW